MAYMAFIAVLFGAAGVVGGIEAGSAAGTTAAAVIHIGGIIALAAAVRKEAEGIGNCGDDSSADKPPGREG